MLEFNFSYKNHEIKYTIDVLGREKCYLDDNLISKSSTSWIKTSRKVEIQLEQENLVLERLLTSFQDAEYRLSLSNSNQVIEEQTDQY